METLVPLVSLKRVQLTKYNKYALAVHWIRLSGSTSVTRDNFDRSHSNRTEIPHTMPSSSSTSRDDTPSRLTSNFQALFVLLGMFTEWPRTNMPISMGTSSSVMVISLNGMWKLFISSYHHLTNAEITTRFSLWYGMLLNHCKPDS